MAVAVGGTARSRRPRMSFLSPRSCEEKWENSTVPHGFAVAGLAKLETQDNLPQLDSVAFVQLVTGRHGDIVDARVVGRGVVVHQNVAIALPDDDRMPLFDAHVAKKGDVSMLIASQPILRLVQRILATFL